MRGKHKRFIYKHFNYLDNILFYTCQFHTFMIQLCSQLILLCNKSGPLTYMIMAIIVKVMLTKRCHDLSLYLYSLNIRFSASTSFKGFGFSILNVHFARLSSLSLIGQKQ